VYVAGEADNIFSATSGPDGWVKRFAPGGTEVTVNWGKTFHKSLLTDRCCALAIGPVSDVFVAAGLWTIGTSGYADWVAKRY